MRILSFGLVILVTLALAGCLGSNDTYDFNGQLKADTTIISNYVSLFGSGAIKIPPGVWYEIDTAGTGLYPSYQDTITVTFKGIVMSTGATFQNQTTPIAYTLAGLINGWQIALPRFREGTYGKIYVPSGLAYGNVGLTNVPANSNLEFHVKVKKVSGYKTRKDIALIDKYLTDNNIANVIQHDSGIRYTMDVLGSGQAPSPSDYITITYTGKLLSSPSTAFGTVSTPTELYLPALLNSWNILIPEIPTGSSFTMYVPSELAYDAFGSQNVPAYANLIFQVHLISSRH